MFTLQSRNICVKYFLYRELIERRKATLAVYVSHPAVVNEKDILFSMCIGGKEDFYMSYLNRIKESSKEIKKVSSLCGVAMLTAVKSVISIFRIQVSNILEIGFSHLAVGVSGMYYGPLLTGIAGVVADTIEFMLRPTGPYFPGFAISEFVIGFIYGSFFYKKEITWKRVLAARVLIVLVVDMLLTPLWLNIMYGNAYWALFSARITVQLAKFPIDFILLYLLLKSVQRIKKT